MQPSVELLGYTMPVAGHPVLDEPLDIVEFAGRWDYGPKSVAKMGDRDIIRRWIATGEESMVELVDAAFLVTCSRVVSHELVRHRLASFQQESQRYVKYDEESADDLFFVPDEVEMQGGTEAEMLMYQHYTASLQTYKRLKELGVKSQIARYVLPNGTRARIVVKANLREWRHILKLRMHKSAQPEMRDIAQMIYAELVVLFPEVFAGIAAELEAGERASR